MIERSLEQRTLVEGVTALLREMVLDGEYLPGESLPLREMAARLSVSVMPVREALRALANEGLVEYLPHRGARVSPLRPDHLEDLYDFRIAVETAALRAAIPRLAAADYDRLESLLSLWCASPVPPNDAQYQRAHRDFHFGIYALGKSQWYGRTIPQLWEASERYRRWAIRLRGLPESRWGEHAQILHLMRSGDVTGATEALTDHLKMTLNMLRRTFHLEGAASAHENDGVRPAKPRRS